MKKTKRKTTNKPIRCPYCGSIAVIRPASEIYNDSRRKDDLYVCSHYPECKSYVGMYAGSKTPLGPLANGDLRHLRIRAHRKFDQLWQSGVMSRGDAYKWMADYLCIPLRDAHIGKFNKYYCEELIKKCDSILLAREEAV